MQVLALEDGSTVEVSTQADLTEVLPRILPAGWHLMQMRDMPHARWFLTDAGLRICASIKRERDQKRWLHVSFSREGRLPSWEELTLVKDVVIGATRTALQVLPPKSKYVNHHPYTLHLWTCLEGDVTPDFTDATGMI